MNTMAGSESWHQSAYTELGNPMYANPQGSVRLPRGPVEQSWQAAFGSGGFDDEPPLSEELGINVDHIRKKALVVLNPRNTLEPEILNDDDLAGPLLFCLSFGAFLLLSGKFHFGYIYGLALIGCIALYFLLNLMSPSGLDGYRTASVLGYCLLPLVLLSSLSAFLPMEGLVLFIATIFSVAWCTYSASTMFVTVLGLHNQRLLIAYPVGLFYTCFALMSIF